MNPELKKQLQHLDGVDVSWGVSMAGHTTLRVGGPVFCLLRPLHLAGLQAAVRVLNTHSFPYFVLGRGSNILASDSGIRAAAISLEYAFSQIKTLDAGETLRVGAGLRLTRVLRYCLQHGLGGLEFLGGIPGSVGGALRMNAGSHGQAMADVCTSALLLNADSSLQRLPAALLEFSYRRLELPRGTLVIEVDLSVAAQSPASIRARLRRLLENRKAAQPWQFPSAGSVFKNPPGDFAGRLIEAAGLKGLSVGDAQISEKHANFIINRGQARARDILALIRLVQEGVQQHSGTRLELEVEVLGDNANISQREITS